MVEDWLFLEEMSFIIKLHPASLFCRNFRLEEADSQVSVLSFGRTDTACQAHFIEQDTLKATTTIKKFWVPLRDGKRQYF